MSFSSFSSSSSPSSFIGNGVQGTVSLTTFNSVKKENKDRQNKVAIQAAVAAGEVGIGPVVYDYSTYTMEMEYIEGTTLENIFLESKDINQIGSLAWRAGQLVAQLNKLGYEHGDVHAGNFIVSNTGRLYLIDYGFAYVRGDKDRTSDEDNDSGPYTAKVLGMSSHSPNSVKYLYLKGYEYEMAK